MVSVYDHLSILLHRELLIEDAKDNQCYEKHYAQCGCIAESELGESLLIGEEIDDFGSIPRPAASEDIGLVEFLDRGNDDRRSVYYNRLPWGT